MVFVWSHSVVLTPSLNHKENKSTLKLRLEIYLNIKLLPTKYGCPNKNVKQIHKANEKTLPHFPWIKSDQKTLHYIHYLINSP